MEEHFEETEDEAPEEYIATCPECGEAFGIELEDDDEIEDGIEAECPHCNKEVTLKEEDF